MSLLLFDIAALDLVAASWVLAVRYARRAELLVCRAAGMLGARRLEQRTGPWC